MKAAGLKILILSWANRILEHIWVMQSGYRTITVAQHTPILDKEFVTPPALGQNGVKYYGRSISHILVVTRGFQ